MDVITNLKTTPLSEDDIKYYLNGRTKICLYRQLNRVKNINQLLSPYGNCIILIETEPHFGHWICLKKTRKDGRTILSFFDSYGGFPDTQKKYVNKDFLLKSGQYYDKIRELMYIAAKRYKYILEFSQKKLQNIRNPQIATCGHWCCVFIESGMDVDDFNKYIYSYRYKNKDDLVSLLFYESLMKKNVI